MEIGHNILHGQWDWMRDPKIHSTTWEWDMASPAEQWKHSHNEMHHTYTNVVGKDNDLGYGIMRVDEDQRWTPFHLGQPIWCFINAMFFEYGIAAYDLDLGAVDQEEADQGPGVPAPRPRRSWNKIRKQVTKDYVVHPLLSIPTGSFLSTLAANFTANIVRNLWAQLGHPLRPLPRGRRDLREALDRRARPRASGTSGRCSAAPTSPAPRRCTS